MEYDCHIFLKYLVFQMKNLVFRSNRIRNFEILGFSLLEFEILGISSKNLGFIMDFMYVL